MTTNPSTRAAGTHLTDEQFSALLLGEDVDAQAKAHMAHCTRCLQEAETFKRSVDLFGTASLAWTKTKQPRQSLLPVFRYRQRRAIYVPLVFTLAAMLLVLVGIPVGHHDRVQQPGPRLAQVLPQDSAAEIAEDNHLLQSVDLVLSSSEGSPLPESHLAAYVRPASRTDLRLK